MPEQETPTATKPEPQAPASPYVFPFSVGADPEFTVVSGSRPMHAEDIFRTFFAGLQGGDHGFIVPGGNIGWDNHPATGELRPNPGTPQEVVANLRLMFEEANKRMPFVDLTTLTVAASTGGHIHLSVPEELNVEIQRAGSSAGTRWGAIERAVGTFLILIMMGENNLSRKMRQKFQRGNYGDILDFRVDQKFSHPSGAPGYTLEVRGPTAEWITTEKIALGTLAYMAIAWDCIIRNDLEAIRPILFRNKTQAHEFVEPLVVNYANMQKAYLDKMRPFIRKHPAYKDFKGPLELILSPARVIAEKQRVHYSINEGWGLAMESKRIATNKFLDDDAIEEATSKFPEHVIRNLSQFAWNDDLNVEQFATGLSKRCIALNWKPQHEYFFFGLKKGFDTIIMRDEDGNFVSGMEIARTKADVKLIENKFKRLNTRAAPVYGRVINHRTGKLAKKTDNRRVMIGIPYRMRQKGDLKALIRLILKFEKNPKEFSALDVSSLPEGASHLEEALMQEESIASGVERAQERGEPPQRLPDDLIEAELSAEAEASRSDSVINMSPASMEAAHRGLSRLTDMLATRIRLFGDDDVFLLADVIEVLSSGFGRHFPGFDSSNQQRITLATQLARIMSSAFENDEDGRVMLQEESMQRDNLAAISYLICVGIGQTSRNVSLTNRANIHIVSRRPDGRYEFVTPARTDTVRVDGFSVIGDLLGIQDHDRDTVRQILDNHSIRVSFESGTEPRVALFRVGGEEIVNITPDDNYPHVWSLLAQERDSTSF